MTQEKNNTPDGTFNDFMDEDPYNKMFEYLLQRSRKLSIEIKDRILPFTEFEDMFSNIIEDYQRAVGKNQEDIIGVPVLYLVLRKDENFNTWYKAISGENNLGLKAISLTEDIDGQKYGVLISPLMFTDKQDKYDQLEYIGHVLGIGGVTLLCMFIKSESWYVKIDKEDKKARQELMEYYKTYDSLVHHPKVQEAVVIQGMSLFGDTALVTMPMERDKDNNVKWGEVTDKYTISNDDKESPISTVPYLLLRLFVPYVSSAVKRLDTVDEKS